MDLLALRSKIEFRSGSEPLLLGTSVEIYRIVALLVHGSTVDQLLTDYPSLLRKHIETAQAYANIYPDMGRPRRPNHRRPAVEVIRLKSTKDF